MHCNGFLLFNFSEFMESWDKMFNEHLFMKHWCDIYLEKVNLGTTTDENFSSGSIFTIFSWNSSGGKPYPLLPFVCLKSPRKVQRWTRWRWASSSRWWRSSWCTSWRGSPCTRRESSRNMLQFLPHRCLLAPTGALYLVVPYYRSGNFFRFSAHRYIDFIFDWQWHCHWLMLIDADWCWLMPIEADWGWLVLFASD